MLIKSFFSGFVCLLISAPLVAADVQAGKKLLEGNCVQCHDTEVYTRADRKVSSLPGLHNQVKRCELALGLTWFDEDIKNTAAYLNQEFYKFK